MSILGAILAGGAARRFGGDKAAAVLNGRPLIEHVAAALAPHVASVMVVGRAWPGLVDIADPPGEQVGPLGGLSAALAYARENGFSAVLSAPCDTPLLPEALVAQVASAACAYVPQLPVLGIWPATLGDRLAAHLCRDPRRSMRGWARQAGAAEIDWPAEIPNINRPDDLDRLTGAALDLRQAE